MDIGRFYARVFDAVAGNPTQDTVFADAFCCTFAVGHGIACAAVQQSVVASGGAGCEVLAFDQKHLEASQGTVAGCSGSCGTSANDNDVVFLFQGFHGWRVVLRISSRAKVSIRFEKLSDLKPYKIKYFEQLFQIIQNIFICRHFR